MTGQEWLETCKVIGAGISFISVPALIMLWRQYLLERKERAESERANLLVMTKMTGVVDALPAAIKESAAMQIAAFKEAVIDVKDHIDNHVKPGSARRGG